MAGKGDKKREIQAADLKRVIADLMSEMAVEEVPYGWVAMATIVEEAKKPISSVRRSLELRHIPWKKFRIMYNGRCVKMVHYQLFK